MGEKSSLNLEKRYRLLVFKEKSYTCRNAKKHPRLCLSSVINSLEFFLFYCCVSSTFLSSFCSFTSFSLNSFSCYIPWFLHHFHYPRVSQVLEFPCPISHLLEISTISCKVACLLFMHHLHMNVARELVGKHLMWR